MTRFSCWLVGWMLLALPAAQASILLVNGGHSSNTIMVDPQASPAVKGAAQELSDDLKAISGATIPVSTESPRGHAIFVQTLNPAVAQPDETFWMRTSHGNVYLIGNSPRGTLYAVYTFLENYLGVRWYAPDATVLPPQPTIQIPDLNVQQSPAFSYRDTDEHLVFQSAAWDAHVKLNGTSVPDDPAYGGINRLFNGAENFYALVPPGKYFADHPEYFSLIGGKRSAQGDSQLCLTNPDVLRIVTDALVAEAKQNPKELTLGLSPNDAPDGSCQCDACRASDALYGAPSGTLLHFVNQVAAGVQAALPGRKIWVETLAYQYTERAPNAGSIHPADNVLVCLAPIYACDGHPLATDPENAKSNTALKAWSVVAPDHLQIWHYVTNFAHYLQPYPDWDELGADMPYYKANGVSGMFCEGDYNSNGELMPMRTWVLGHLMWNPHQEVWPLVKDFCDGYYGAAGTDIYQYLRLFHDDLQKPGVHLHLYDAPTAGYLNAETLGAANRLLDHAEAAVPTDPLKSRVEEVRLGLRGVELERSVPTGATTPADRTLFRDRLARFVDDLHRFKVDYISEGRPAAAWIADMQKAAG